MSTEIDKNKHPFKIFFLLLPSVILFIVSVFFVRPEDLISISDVKDFESSIHLCCVGLNIITLTSIFRIFAFGIEPKLTNKRTNILLWCYKHVKNDTNLSVLIGVDVTLVIFMILQPNESTEFWRQALSYILIILCFSAFLACVYMFFYYDDADLASSQDLETSIGALWALGSYTAFYEKVLIDITRRMQQFEDEKNFRFIVKKLIIICPLSCNVTGSLADQHAEITYVDSLKPIVEDEGANLNRCLKSTIYCISGRSEYCIAAEMPSPLATLWELRGSMNETIWKYHRDCFIHVLKNLVRNYPCIVLEYDDQDPEPLHIFLLSRLNNHCIQNSLKLLNNSC